MDQYSKHFKLLLIFMILILKMGFAQGQHRITGSLTNSQHEPIDYATVVLFTDSDSSLVSSSLTDSLGGFEFKNLPLAGYYLKTSHLLYQDTTIAITIDVLTTAAPVEVQLSNSKNYNLKEVTVTASKPLMERSINGLIFNVANTSFAIGNNAWDVLKRAPSVQASEQGQLGIASKSGVIVYINGKRSYLTGEDLMNMLKTMPSDNIQKIEIITSPSAKYDAEGNTGIINIVLQKDPSDGFKGYLTVSNTQATYNHSGANINLNYRKDGLNLYGIFSGGTSRNKITEEGLTEFNGQEASPTGIYFNETDRVRESSPNNFAGIFAGVDYNLSGHAVIGAQVRYNYRKQDIENTTLTSYYATVKTALDSLTNTIENVADKGRTISANVNYLNTLDTLGKSISVDADYLSYYNFKESVNATHLLGVDGDLKSARLSSYFTNNVPQRINIYSVKGDFTLPLNDKSQLVTGAKYSSTKTDNDFFFANFTGGTFVEDLSKSNHFIYHENIFAVYALFKQSINPKLEYQVGLRTENTITKAELLTTHEENDRNYWQFFPTLNLNYNVSDKHQFFYSFSRRIDRPGFSDLNPFRYYVTPNIYAEGNPYLQPAYTISNELGYTLLGKYNFTLFHYDISNAYSQLPEIEPRTQILHYVRENYGNDFYAGITSQIPVRIAPWWEVNNDVTAAITRSRGHFKAYTIDNRGYHFDLTTNHSFSLSKLTHLDLLFSYIAPTVNSVSSIRSKYNIDISAKQLLFNDRLTVIVYLSDIFRTSIDRISSTYLNQKQYNKNYYDNRSARLSIRYNFGNNKVKGSRARESGNSDLRNRIGS